jgi:hypothetical protein
MSVSGVTSETDGWVLCLGSGIRLPEMEGRTGKMMVGGNSLCARANALSVRKHAAKTHRIVPIRKLLI